MTHNLNRYRLTTPFIDSQSGYQLQIYVIGDATKRRPGKPVLHVYHKSLILEIACPPEADIESFINSVKSLAPSLSAEQERDIRESRTYQYTLASNKAEKVAKDTNACEELRGAGIKLDELTQRRIDDAIFNEHLDVNTPTYGKPYDRFTGRS